MRRKPITGVVAGLAAAAALLAGCAPTVTYTSPKNMAREDAVVDVLDCRKAAVLKFKATRLKHARDATSYKARKAAADAANAAHDRCLKARGWKKRT